LSSSTHSKRNRNKHVICRGFFIRTIIKEKDAFLLLKEKKFLKDKDQEPAIRVALRSIKDFAIPLEKDQCLYWRYFTIPETEFKIQEKVERQEKPEEKIPEPPEKIAITRPIEIAKTPALNIFDKTEEKPKTKKTIKKIVKRKPVQKTNEKFFNKVKEFLSEKSIEISGIEGFSKNELFLKIKDTDNEKLLVAYNKKRITETDIIKAYKKASEINLPYTILSLGEPAKKIQNFIDAIKNLEEIDKIK